MAREWTEVTMVRSVGGMVSRVTQREGWLALEVRVTPSCEG